MDTQTPSQPTPTPEELPETSVSSELENQVRELEDKLLRALAEQENQRRRADQELRQQKRYSAASLGLDLLPALDTFTRAAAYIPEAQQKEGWVTGLLTVAKQIEDALSQSGITPISTEIGQVFNPELHEAIGAIPTAEQPPDTILSVAERGFMIHDRVLRPARVMLAQAVS